MPIFFPLTGESLRFVQRMVVARRSFAPDAEMLRADEIGGGPYTLWSGWAYRTRSAPPGDSGRPGQQILDILLPGDLFGAEPALIGRGSDAVRALTEATICVHDTRTFTAVFETRPDLARAFAETQLRDRIRIDARLAALGQGTGAQRAGHLLLELRDRLSRRGMLPADAALVQNLRVPFPLRRRHLGAVLGMSGTHVARSLSELERERLAYFGDNAAVIVDPARLAAFCGYAATPADAGRRALL
jgi:CRP-like cAMP-binding protein